MNKTKSILAGALVAFLGWSCSSDDDGPARANLNVRAFGLESLPNGNNYQGWLVLENGDLRSTSKFNNIDSERDFSFIATELESATEFFITVEQPDDNDNEPSGSIILKGNFNGASASLSFEDAVTSLSNIAGKFLMGTPSDNDSDNEESGVWFMDNSVNPAVAGLQLGALNTGWNYEGWVVINDTPVTTGTFRTVTGQDDFDGYSSNENTQWEPMFPGEDFLINTAAPEGLTFPVDLKGAEVKVSIEPANDKDKAPFFLLPLTGEISQSNVPGELITMTANNLMPQGQATRPQ